MLEQRFLCRFQTVFMMDKNLIEVALKDGIDTLLTCDNGIAAIDEIAYAKEKGMTVLVTDHHEIPYDELDGERFYKSSIADAIVNPHRLDCPYPYKNLCGAAVAWKVVCLLYEACGVEFAENYELLENVAFATVGDIMSLTGENRILVKLGLERIHQTKNPGMRALIAQCGLEPEAIDAFHFGFVLGPCINATGRLDTAKRALELLFETDYGKAVQIANELVVLNSERKELTLEGVKQAVSIYESEHMEADKVLVIYLPEVHESIAGIIAGRIREKYHKPTFILTRAEEGVKGSGRSIEEYSMYEEMCKCKELFTKFGGHPMAAGLSLPEENVGLFREKINALCGLKESDFIPKVKIDVPMPMDYVTKDLVREFSLLAPFGKDNNKPVFADKNIRIKRMWILGKNRNVLKLSMITSNGLPVTGIYFGDVDGFCDYLEQRFGKEQVEQAFNGKNNEITIAIVYFPKINIFRDVEELQFEIQYYQ